MPKGGLTQNGGIGFNFIFVPPSLYFNFDEIK